MKKILCVLGLAMLPWTTQSAEGEFDRNEALPTLPPVEDILPDTLEPETLPEEMYRGAVEPRTQSEPTPPSEEKYTPALLRVTRVKQYETACQYWVKLENRLPFDIRNMTLHFSAYIRNEGYDKPVLFDVATRSFSELRPTDSQFRDVFFPNVQCERLAYIKVEDAGRCSVGNLTKFSSQSGDCTRYLQFRPSDRVCIFLDEGTLGLEPLGGEGRVRDSVYPCGHVPEEFVTDLMERFLFAYEARDLDAFLALFDPDAVVNGEPGIERVVEAFSNRVASARRRDMSIEKMAWQPGKHDARVTIRYVAKTVDEAETSIGAGNYSIFGEIVAMLRDDGLVITRYDYDRENPLTSWSLLRIFR